MTATENRENLFDGVAECEEVLAMCEETVRLLEQASNSLPFGSRDFYEMKQHLLDAKKLVLEMSHLTDIRKTDVLPPYTQEEHDQVVALIENIRTDLEAFSKSIESI